MPSRSLARPAALGAATVFVLSSALADAQQPAVPLVTEIPVAPPPKPRKAATPPSSQSPATTTTTVTTTTITTPSLVAIAPEPSSAAQGVPEAMPTLPSAPPQLPAPPSFRVVLVDELPSRTTHARASDSTSHTHHAKQGRHGRPYHPAPGIVVDVTPSPGGPGVADLQRSARDLGYWPFRHCYEEGLRHNQQLAGSVKFGLARESGVLSTQLVESTVRDESVTLCVLREARQLDLTWGPAGSDAHADGSAEMKVSLATGDEPVPTPRAVPHAEELREALHASFPAVEQCYASELPKHPDAGGSMQLRFSARSSGEIRDVSESEPKFVDSEVTRCVLGVYKAAKLPKVHGAHASSFVYALHFESATSDK